MRVALVGAEIEQSLGLRYTASALEQKRHQVEIIPFNINMYDGQSKREASGWVAQPRGPERGPVWVEMAFIEGRMEAKDHGE